MIITTFFSKNCENFTSCGMSCGSCMMSLRSHSQGSRGEANFHESRVGEQCKVATTPEKILTTCAFRRQAKAKRSNTFVHHRFGRVSFTV